MWYRIKARDMRIFKPEGKVITFWLSGDSEEEIRKILKKKNITEIKWIKEDPDAFEE